MGRNRKQKIDCGKNIPIIGKNIKKMENCRGRNWETNNQLETAYQRKDTKQNCILILNIGIVMYIYIDTNLVCVL